MGGVVSFYKKHPIVLIVSLAFIIVGIMLLALHIYDEWLFGWVFVIVGAGISIGFKFADAMDGDPVLYICSPFNNTNKTPKEYSYKLYEKKEYMKVNATKWKAVEMFMSEYDAEAIGPSGYNAAMELLFTNTTTDYVICSKPDKVEGLRTIYNDFIKKGESQLNNVPILHINATDPYHMYIIKKVKSMTKDIPYSYQIYDIPDSIIADNAQCTNMVRSIIDPNSKIVATKTINPK